MPTANPSHPSRLSRSADAASRRGGQGTSTLRSPGAVERRVLGRPQPYPIPTRPTPVTIIDAPPTPASRWGWLIDGVRDPRLLRRISVRVLVGVIAVALVAGVVWLAVCAVQALIAAVTALVAALVAWVIATLLPAAVIVLTLLGLGLALVSGSRCPGLHCRGCRR